MSTQVTGASLPPNLLRSAGAVVAGMAVVVVFSLGTDWVLRIAGMYPAAGAAMPEPGLNLLALCYRCIYNVIGACIVLVLAAGNGLRLIWIFTLIGFTLAAVGAVATIPMHLGPAWYPILLAISTFPCSWLGWKLRRAHQGAKVS